MAKGDISGDQTAGIVTDMNSRLETDRTFELTAPERQAVDGTTLPKKPTKNIKFEKFLDDLFAC